MKEQLITTQKQNKKNKNYDTHPLPPTQTLISMNHPPPTPQPSHPPIICCNNTMIIISLAQIRQSDGCGSVRNDEIFNSQLGSGAGTIPAKIRI